MKFLVDVWGGRNHMTHVASRIFAAKRMRPVAIENAVSAYMLDELRRGFLVTSRRVDRDTKQWSARDNFDSREKGQKSRARKYTAFAVELTLDA